MKLNLVVLVLFSSVLVTFGAPQEKAYDHLMNKLNIALPNVGEKKLTLMKIFDEHKKPLHDNLENFKEKMNGFMMDAGFEILDKGLNLAEILQNMTQKIKSDVLNYSKKQ
ncbi:uncharacterized protein LOC123676669 [Harmonia axyridis]|uniref:uncharacterized protein LOC123676669 n=1 Tax=Harmonia axyridis TaxID=115357 RepID=UPI001E275D79|nr:uncharacterized protein LOC123676669 [Harmonia axyridis]